VIEVRKVDGLDGLPTAKLRSDPIKIFGFAPDFGVGIDAPDEATADAIATLLRRKPRIDIRILFDAKRSKQNSFQVMCSALKNPSLYATLVGKGTDEVYVHRDDMRKLMEGSHLIIATQGMFEEPEKVALLFSIGCWLRRPESTATVATLLVDARSAPGPRGSDGRIDPRCCSGRFTQNIRFPGAQPVCRVMW
jgi:hypothetical protein